ncbi:MAG: Ig-like domain-containing protein [Candidatus Aenigmatarchaeota archaeon]
MSLREKYLIFIIACLLVWEVVENMPWGTSTWKGVLRDVQLVKRKLQLMETSTASTLQELQSEINQVLDRLDKIEQRLDNMQAATNHTLTVTITASNPFTNFYKTVVVTGSCTCSQSHSLSRAALYVDDKLVSEKTSPPWQWDLDTTRYSNGSHMLKIGFWCSQGGYGEKTQSITVNNAVSTGGASGQHGCTITICNEKPLNGSIIDKDYVTVFIDVKDSVGHPVTSVKANDGHSERPATKIGEGNMWYLGTFYFDKVYVPGGIWLPLIISVTATCAAGNTATRVLSYKHA